MKKVLCLVLVLLMIVSLAYGESNSGGSTFNFNGGDISNHFYDFVGDFNDGLALVQEGDKWGFINTNGTLVIPCEWDNAKTFSEGFAVVEKDKKCGFIDTTGTVVIPCDWIDAYGFNNGLAKVFVGTKEDYGMSSGKYGYIDTNGTLVVPCEWPHAFDFSDGLAMVRKDDKYGYVDSTGELVIPCEWDSASEFSEGLVVVKRGSKWYSIDTNGTMVDLGPWEYVGSFNEGLAAVRKDGKYGYIDITGTLMISCDWDDAEDFSEGLAAVEKDGKEGYIDMTGTIVIPCEWDPSWGMDFSDGLVRVKKDEKFGYIDTTGNVVVPCEYDIAYYGEGFFTLLDGGYLTILDREGNEVEFIDEPVESSPAESAEEAAAEYETLTIGSKGDAVKKLQQRLNELGYNVGTADGDFGKKTESAIQKFQQANGLSATGIADAQTQTLLYSDTNVSNSTEEGVSELVEFKSMMMESVSGQISSAADLTQTENNRAILAALLSLEITYQRHDDFTIDTTMPIFVSRQGNIAAAAFGGDGKYVMVIYQSKPLSTSYGFIYNDDPGIVKATLEAISDSVWTVSLDDFTEKLTLLNQQLQ